MRTWLPLYACLSLFACGLHGAQILSSIPGSAEPRPATLLARRLDGSAPAIQQAITVPGTTDIALPDGLWELRVLAGGVWMAPTQLRNADSASVKLWPTGTVAGTSNGARALRARFTARDANGPSGEVECETDGSGWVCEIPRGLYDLQFLSRGCAPEFRFAAAIPADDRTGRLRLQFVAGASLSGTVEAARGLKIPLDGVALSLIPAGSDLNAAKHTAHADGKGFFQFKGLSPGDYTIRAERKGIAAQSKPVRILTGTAAELNEPLILDTPKKLTVTVMPAVDPAALPWSLRLSSYDPRLRRGDIVSESRVSAAGEWTSPPLVSGEYRIEIHTAAGEHWKSAAVTIERDDVITGIAAIPEKLTGMVTIGDRPLKATLSFGGEWGVKLHSDMDGSFAGDIPPHEGEDEQVVLVEAETPRVKRTVRTKIIGSVLKIDLPTTTLMGRVLNDDGSPASHGRITVTGDQPDTFEQVFTEADGSFQLTGYEAGKYRVTAYAFERSSKSLGVELRKDESAEIELILERQEIVNGRMTVGEIPVIAAEVYAFPRDAWGPTVPQAVTDENGYFQLTLPPGTTRFDVFAVHPAFDVTFGRTILRKDKELQVRTNQIGGTIVVESAADELVLRHHGSEMTAGWLIHRTGAVKTADRLTVPRLEPGQYAACTPDGKTCVSGHLAPHGTLTLTLD